MTTKLMTPLIAEFLLERPDLWDKVDFDADCAPVYELPVALEFIEWDFKRGGCTREVADARIKELRAIAEAG